jgi:hypothetical protein
MVTPCYSPSTASIAAVMCSLEISWSGQDGSFWCGVSYPAAALRKTRPRFYTQAGVVGESPMPCDSVPCGSLGYAFTGRLQVRTDARHSRTPGQRCN